MWVSADGAAIIAREEALALVVYRRGDSYVARALPWTAIAALKPTNGRLTVRLADGLVDRENADIVENGLGIDGFGLAGPAGHAFSLGENDIHLVVRQDEAARARFGRNFSRNRAHAGRQDRSHEAGAIALHELGFADRFARDEGRACNGADDLAQRFGSIAAADEGGAGRCRRPGLPLHVVRSNGLAERDIAARHKHIGGVDADSFLNRLRVRTAREIGSSATGTDGNSKDDNPRGIHTLHFPHHAATEPSLWSDLTS